MTSQENLPKELTAILDNPEFDDEAGIVIESVKFIEDNLYLTFAIRFYEDTPQQLWQLYIEDVKEEKIINGWTQDISLYSEHPLLLKYNDTHTELYFNGTTNHSQELFVDIFQSILQLSDNTNDVFKYIYLPDSVSQLSKQGYGLFARGPKTILNIYQQCLTRQGIKAYFIGDIERSKGDEQLMLFKLGESHVIGQKFLFERLE